MTVNNSVLLSTKHEYRLNTDTLFEVVTFEVGRAITLEALVLRTRVILTVSSPMRIIGSLKEARKRNGRGHNSYSLRLSDLLA
jgi:hypothetical protein